MSLHIYGGTNIMMRSMYSAVSGLKAHQTRMDVIGNNIANVNTVAYKSQSMTFSEVFYQTTQIASGPNAETGKGGWNIRLKHGSQLLKNKSMSIAEVAYECGFSNPKYFATCFKEDFGVTPKEYQKSC